MKKEEFLDNNLYAKLFRSVYRALMLNVCFTVTTSPLLIFLSVSALTIKNWPFFLLASLTLVPSIFALIKGIDKVIYEKDLDVTRDYVRFFYQGFKRSVGYGLLFNLIMTICLTDLLFIIEQPTFKWGLPLFILLFICSIGLLINTLYFYVRNPQQETRAIFRIAAYYLVKKWYVSLLNVALLVILLGALVLKPPLGFLVLPSLLLGSIYWNASKLHQAGEENG